METYIRLITLMQHKITSICFKTTEEEIKGTFIWYYVITYPFAKHQFINVDTQTW